MVMILDMAVAVIMDLDTNMAMDMVLTTAMLYLAIEEVISLVSKIHLECCCARQEHTAKGLCALSCVKHW